MNTASDKATETKTSRIATATICGIEWQAVKIGAVVGMSAVMTASQRLDCAEFLALCVARGDEVKSFFAADDADMTPGTIEVHVYSAA